MTKATPDAREGSGTFACAGLIRDGMAVIRLLRDPSLGIAEPTIHLSTPAGAQAVEAQAASAAQSAALDRLFADHLRKVKGHQGAEPGADLAVALPPGVLIHAVEVAQGGARGRWMSPVARLDDLTPTTVEAFRTQLSFGKGRHADGETVKFMCAQVLEPSWELPATPEVLGYVVNAFVIYAYKSIEADRYDARAQVDRYRRRAAQALESMPEGGGGVRNDREHLGISLGTARWHLALGAGDIDLAVRVLLKMDARYRATIDEKLPLNRAYNACRSLLMLGILLIAQGRIPAASQVLRRAIGCFKRAAGGINENRTQLNWFRELADTHQAAIRAMVLLRSLQNDREIDPVYLRQFAAYALRVDSPTYVAKVEAVITDAATRSASVEQVSPAA